MTHLTRRHFIFGSVSSVLASGLVRAQSNGVQVQTRKSASMCILVNMMGAPSQLDTFDSKDGPWNPRDVDLYSYSGGLLLSRKYFPVLSSQTGDICLLHSLASWELAHTRGQFYLQTGHTQNPAFAADTPHVGAVVAYELGGKGPLPAFLSFGGNGDEQGQGFLPGANAAFSFDPNQNGLSNLRHDYYGNQSQSIFEQNYALIEALDAPFTANPLSAEMAAFSQTQKQARSLIYNAQVEPIFRFTNDEDQRYGNSNIGRGLIVARNLARARLGTSFVSVTQGGWDIHAQQFNRQAFSNIYRQTNELDRAVGNLIMDLKASGHLASTLIVVMGEFGRTPGMLNSRDGRDHYRNVMSGMIAGGGVRGGRAIGVTDEVSGGIVDPGWKGQRAIYPEDIICTIYSALGIQWTKSLASALSGRPFDYITGAKTGDFYPVDEVFG